MKKAVLVVALFTALTQNAMARTDASEMSAMGGLSVVMGSMLVIASPFVLVGSIVNNSTSPNQVNVTVINQQGKEERVAMPREVVEKSQLQAGDKLTITPAKTGAVVSKNDKPLLFMVNPENANLTRSHALAQ